VSKLQKCILQALAFSLLLMIQFLSIKAEKEDFVYDACQSIHHIIPPSINKRIQYAYHSHKSQHKQKHHHRRKIHSVKHISIKFSTPEKQVLAARLGFYSNPHHFSYSEQYSYTYYKDINPPPPKA
jgi:hypothetical protein